MPNANRTNQTNALKRQIQRISLRIQKLQKTSRFYSRIRLSIALLGIAGIAACFEYASNLLGWLLTAVVTTSFCTVLHYHSRLKEAISRYRILEGLRVARIARINLDWEHIPEVPKTPVQIEHPFGIDLDIAGERSLHQLIDTSISIEGSGKLLNLLLQTEPELYGILKRQMLVRELSPLVLFRHKLIVNGMRVAGKSSGKLDIQSILGWFQGRGSNKYLPKALFPLTILAVADIVIFYLAFTGMIPQYFLALFFVYLLPLLFFQIDIAKAFRAAMDMEAALNRLLKVFISLETYGYYRTPNLAELCAPFREPRNRPSVQLGRISRIVSGISVRSNPVIWLLLNALMPWDVYFVRRLEHCKETISELLPSWLDILTEVEALSSLADFAYLNQDYTYPELRSANSEGLAIQCEKPALAFRADSLGHPLLPAHSRVSNSISFNEENRIALITGSNMAGKSSFLRTIGVNLCLAYAGAPVCASRFTTGIFRIFACMRINDSLTDGFSFFYAEVKRLKMLLTSVEANDCLPVIFLLDEIFRGTNNHERFIGSRAYIRALAEHPTLGAIATHDLELVKLADENRAITNYHFREEVAGGRMVFDYKLRPGPCPTTNALKIMAMAGLPVSNSDTERQK